MLHSRIILLLLLTQLVACGPGAVIGAVGNAVNRSIQRAEDAAAAENGDPITEPRQSSYSYTEYDRQQIAKANLDLGIAYMKQGDNRAALDKLTRARIAKPDYAPTYNVLGVFYQKIGDNTKAESNFEKSLDLDPDNFDTLNNYASFLCSTEKPEEAITIYQSAASNKLNQKPDIALANAGLCAINHGQQENAEMFLRQALEMNPKLAPALFQMADISYKNAEYLAADDYLKRYLEISDHSPRTLWLGIQIQQQLGDKNIISSYALLLRNKYADSREAQLLEEAGIY